MTEPKPGTIAARLPQDDRPGRRGLGPGGRRHPVGPRRRGQHDPGRPGRLRRPRHRRGGQRPVDQAAARSSSSPWPTSSRTGSTTATTTLKNELSDKVDVPEDRKFIGFDGYQKAMDCLKPGDVVILATPPAFRWVHFTYAIEKGLNVFMEKPVTVDGPTTPQDARAGRGGEEEEPQGRRRPDVPPLRGPRGAVRPHQGRRRSATSSLLRAYRRPARSARRFTGPKPDGHQRAAVPDPAVPRLPLGQRRLLQRLPDPQHRRVLLDEGRLAGQGQGLRRPALPRRLHRPELRHLLGRVHLRRRHQAVPRRPEHRRLPPGVRQLRPRHQGLGGHLARLGHTPGQVPDLQGPEHRPKTTSSGPSRSPSRTRTSSSGTT